MKNRWYDNHEETIETLNALKDLDENLREKLSVEIIEIANQIKSIQREQDEQPLSIGLERVLGLYQSSNCRRWYDKNENLSNAIRTISTLPKEDFLNIMEGLFQSLKD